jgi:hypothetical protein
MFIPTKRLIAFVLICLTCYRGVCQNDSTYQLWNGRKALDAALRESENISWSKSDTIIDSLGFSKEFYMDSIFLTKKYLVYDSLGKLVEVGNREYDQNSKNLSVQCSSNGKAEHIGFRSNTIGVSVNLFDSGKIEGVALTNDVDIYVYNLSLWETGLVRGQLFQFVNTDDVLYTFYWPNGFLKSTGVLGRNGPKGEWRFYKDNGRIDYKARRAFKKYGKF